MKTPTTEEELQALKERPTWLDDDLVFSSRGRNMTRALMKEVDSDMIALLVEAGRAVVLRSFEARDRMLFQPDHRVTATLT